MFSDVVMPDMSRDRAGNGDQAAGLEPADHPDQRLQQRPCENGTHGFELLRKPYSIDDLARTLRTTLDSKEVASASM